MTKRIILTEGISSIGAAPTEGFIGSRPEPESRSAAGGLTLVDVAQSVLRHARLIGFAFGAVLVVTALILLLIPNKYRSTATILPSGTQDQLSELKNLAGLGSLDASRENPSELFPSILRSRLIADTILNRTYTFSDDGEEKTVKLADYFNEANPDKLVEVLNQTAGISSDKKTGVISLSVETKYPALSQLMAQSYLTELEGFNLYSRRSQARENANYLSRQVEQTKIELAKAEQALQDFQSANRNWAESSDPEVLRLVGQLQREEEIQNRKFLYLTQEHEMAKLTAQKDVPIVSVLDAPSLPTEKSSPHRLMILVLVAILTMTILLSAVTAYEAAKLKLGIREQLLLEGIGHKLTSRVPFLRAREVIAPEAEDVIESANR